MSNDNFDDRRNGHERYPAGRTEDEDGNVIRLPSRTERETALREQQRRRENALRLQGTGPVIRLPPVTKAMAALFGIVHLAVSFGIADPEKQWLFDHFGFTPGFYTLDFQAIPAFAGPLTYMLFHGSWLHLIMNILMLMAFGAGVEKWMGGRRMLILFVLCGLAAAAFHFILSPFSETTMIGASGGISGLFAAALIMLDRQGRLSGGRRGLFQMAGLWIAISFVFGLLGSPDGAPIAWAAHIGGFLAGFALIKPVLRMR